MRSARKRERKGTRKRKNKSLFGTLW